jgi:hypothetical protein
MGWLENSINQQRDYLIALLHEPLGELAQLCMTQWEDRESLDRAIKAYLQNRPEHRCRLLYAIDLSGKQYSSNISDELVDDTIIGQNLAERPYLQFLRGRSSHKRVFLSDVYIDKQTRKPCITVLHLISDRDKELGYIAADFGLNDLPLRETSNIQPREWQQIKGDPSIRSSMFQQQKTCSLMDQRIDEVLDVVESLITEQGVFHVKLHFSSSRATLWAYNDPYRYRLHVLDEIVDPDVCLVYAKMPYPDAAEIPAAQVRSILRSFKLLREVDEIIYLRAASLNIMNGLVGLNFSCDGTHYMSARAFLEKDLKFWLGDYGYSAACG